MLESTTDRLGPPVVVPPRAAGFSLLVAVPFALLQFGLWLILSAERDWFHLSLGALTACTVAVLAARLVAQSPPIIDGDGQAFRGIPWYRFVTYLPWLGAQVAVASLRVAWVVLHPRLPIDPRLVRVRAPFPHTLAKLTLANSITLTPGTVTLDVDGDDFLVHSLTESGEHELEEGTMVNRVSSLFGVTAGATERR